ncbi:TPA: hypothetical protein QDC20_006475 [Burkholderia aenigmatica]|uniref:hypothetical protein n=1 Tax=Burkholderia sp. AU45251 TaxID=3059204 RepID=UPI002653B1BA|nr:hypothetical protein [Burkholderia sp. AU45251]HDR9487706.1 hypothetical protein [Burkholderia aenigmatica]MDN7520520.1 hypothetical protein [Burkholderia sp. AU45251]HDR9519484.1 hypothetical protein [Burkholderia aenigmatica]HDR9596514.1 hypothetical protein [Burkholderia aenigmatica]HDR9603891.1 hypothetical protein [Burkholderia aenigmatica]
MDHSNHILRKAQGTFRTREVPAAGEREYHFKVRKILRLAMNKLAISAQSRRTATTNIFHSSQ